MPPATPMARRRPWSVTLASVLMMVAAVAMLGLVAVMSYDLAHFEQALAAAARRTEANPGEIASVRSENTVTDVVIIVISALTALVLVAFGWSVRRGNNVLRVLACVATGLVGLCCCGVVGLGQLAGNSSRGSSRLLEEALRQRSASMPPWAGALEVLAFAAPMASIVACVLLLLPPSNRFFRPPAVTFDAGPAGVWSAQAGPGAYYTYPNYAEPWPAPAPWTQPPSEPDQPPPGSPPGLAPDQPPPVEPTRPPDWPPPPA